MTECLQTKKSNCKNCYKCIRKCPIKSIKFSNGQAQIIGDECILCGKCYVTCPQEAKQIRNDTDKAKELLKTKSSVYVSLAPSFLANYHGKNLSDMKIALKKLGFTDVFETAEGATTVKKQYEKIIKERKQSVIISSCCHTVNTLIERKYHDALKYLAPVVTPMHAHSELLKKQHPNSGVVFIGPCISKKAEADRYGVVDCVLTFDELDMWLESENIEIPEGNKDEFAGRTRIFPTTGGVFESMDKDSEYSYIAVDGVEECMTALSEIIKGNITKCFIEMSACRGSCINGPIMRKNEHTLLKDLLIVKGKSGKTDHNLEACGECCEFNSAGSLNKMPGSSAIEEILKKMGKTTPDKELNCGSCGYETCRDKAVAVLLGKADLSMCLPFLKDKAENFSDTIINNTPNGIIVLSEQLEIQQLNRAAKKILNLPAKTDLNGDPVVRILDPADYVIALGNEENVYDNRKYLAEYGKYVEETIIYDKEYHILMIIMKDVSDEEKIQSKKIEQSRTAIEITDKVVEKQMRIVQEIASLLGETTAETKIALTKLKETLSNE